MSRAPPRQTVLLRCLSWLWQVEFFWVNSLISVGYVCADADLTVNLKRIPLSKAILDTSGALSARVPNLLQIRGGKLVMSLFIVVCVFLYPVVLCNCCLWCLVCLFDCGSSDKKRYYYYKKFLHVWDIYPSSACLLRWHKLFISIIKYTNILYKSIHGSSARDRQRQLRKTKKKEL
jgi:hypothetical protein